jgi:YidC/Oxa1 family membrane protein insertase
VPSLVDGGAYWFVDLTVADPVYVLPAASTAVFLLMVELNAADGMEGHDPAMVARMKWIMRAVAFVMPVMAGSMPAVRPHPAPAARAGVARRPGLR